jgi:polygalacturonase
VEITGTIAYIAAAVAILTLFYRRCGMNGLRKRQSLNAVFILFVVFSLLAVNCALAKSAKPKPAVTADFPFVVPDIKEPKFPKKTFRITDFGAVGDGHIKNTEAFAKAIQACADAGGGRVIVPAGLWLTGPIVFKSNINLHLEEGAIILFSPEFEDYPLIKTTWEGLPQVRCTSPLYAENVENIAITGSGIIDGSGQAWRPVKKYKLTEIQWEKLLASGGVVEKDGGIWWPSEGAMNGVTIVEELNRRGDAKIEEYAAAKQFLRPVLVGLRNCKNVLLDGPTFQNSPGWNLHPMLCENVIIRNVNVRNPWYSQNGDGLDIESCRNVIVEKCKFDVGDDGICMKSGKNEYGRKRGKPTENVAIWDCVVYHGHGGFVIGSEMSGGVRNVYVKNCSFLGTDVGIRFKTTRGRGGVVENIYIQDIRMKDIPEDAVLFTMYYGDRVSIPMDDETDSDYEKNVPPVSEETPRIQNIYMKNIICDGARRAVYMQGLPEMAIRNINLEDAVISAKNGVTCIEADNIKFKNVKITPAVSPAFSVFNGRNILLENITVPDSAESFMKLAGGRTAAIKLKGFDESKITKKIQQGKSVKSDALIID